MKVDSLHLVHFRSSRDLTLDLEQDVTVLVGMNGAGKSSILDALAISLSWAAARVRSPNSQGRKILDTDIHNEKTFSWLELACREGNDKVTWRLVQARKGRNPDRDLSGMTSLVRLNAWASDVRDQTGRTGESANLPAFVYYPVNRAVLDIPLRIRKTHAFSQLEAYDDAFTVGANFRDFFEWYRNREDLENEGLRESGRLTEDSQLRAVRQAITGFLPGFSRISVKRNPLRMEVTKGEEKLRIEQMSDGEKCLFAMVGDLARRLAIANPERENPLAGSGIVLIDEIDLHLHPEWQRQVVSMLARVFPNCQFVLSTHSPQVVGEVEARCIRRLVVNRLDGLVATPPPQALGLDSAEILDELMEASSRNRAVTAELARIFRLIDEDDFSGAQDAIQELRDRLNGSIPELVRAEALLAMMRFTEGEEGE